MRRVMIGLGLLGLVQSAHAADLPYLRGSNVPTYHWAGFYAGAQVGYSGASYDFSGGVSSLVNFILRGYPTLAGDVSGWNVLGKSSSSAFTYGGFVGYNAEWEGVILGVELNYNRTSLFKADSNFIVAPDNNLTVISATEYWQFDKITATGATSLKITDVATLRGRAGWEAGPFLPYAFAGVAVGRANVTQSASVSAHYTDFKLGCDQFGNCSFQASGDGTVPVPPNPTALTNSQSGRFVYGGAGGLGLDMVLTANVFARLEWEYLLFQPIDGIHANVNSVRTALGVLF
jgi:outer membrane immunogenic protein